MTQIHGSMTIDKVDETMYVSFYITWHWEGRQAQTLIIRDRDQLREQHQLSDEIAQAITSQPVGEQPDEDELDAELEGLEQEAMDERMLKTGTVPVADQINRLPAAANEERESFPYPLLTSSVMDNKLMMNEIQPKTKRSKPRKKTRKQSSKSSVQKWPCDDASILPILSYPILYDLPPFLFPLYSRPLFVFSGCMIE